MNREEAEKLLRGGEEGIQEWNRQREDGEKIPSLNEINLSGANLRGANLRRTDLRGANLRGADLSGADLKGADLEGTDLIGADLSGADLKGADLIGADLIRGNLRGADLSGADLLGANLRGANLSKTNLSETNLSETNLTGVNLSRAVLSGTHLGMTDLSGINLSEVILDDMQRAYLNRLNQTPSRDVETELKITREQVKELQERVEKTGQTGKEQLKLQIDLDEYRARAKQLEEENDSIKAGRKTTETRIESAIQSLDAPNKYISREKMLHHSMFIAYLILAILCLVFLYWSFHKPSKKDNPKQENDQAHVDNDNNKTDQITGFEMINLFAPRILAASLFGIFLTQANRRRRSVQELEERKRSIETLRGVFLAINTLSDNPLLARQRIDGILDKLAQQALELAKNAPNRPTQADHESDHVELLEEIRKCHSLLANKKQ